MVERCNGGIKCAVITGDREKTGKRVVNMTPIFLVLLVAIDPIIAQNGGPPTILVRPQSQQVKAGGIASFYCTAEGAPPPQITGGKTEREFPNLSHGIWCTTTRTELCCGSSL